jgi:tetratricopeptide (TPR) repeat protein
MTYEEKRKRADELYSQAIKLTQSGDEAELERLYKEILEIDGEDINALNNLGTLYMQQFRAEEAEECYKHALSMNTSNPATLTNLGMLYMHQERYPEAMPHFISLLAIKEDSLEIARNLTQIYIYQGKYHEALACHHKITKLYPKDEKLKELLPKIKGIKFK